MRMILTLIYFLGLVSCSVQGVRKIINKRVRTYFCYISAVLTSFAGGMIRDVIILHIYPVVFTTDCLPDTSVVIVTTFLCIHFIHKQKQLKAFVILTDSIGMAQFIAVGVDKALSLKNNYALAVISGVCTSLGGGFVSCIFSREPIKQILLSSLSYKLCSILGVILYVNLIHSGADPIDAQTAMLLYTLCVLPICGNFKAIKKLYIRAMQTTNICMNLECLYTIITLYVHSSQYLYNLPSATKISIHFKTYNKKQIVYLYHRIRQM